MTRIQTDAPSKGVIFMLFLLVLIILFPENFADLVFKIVGW